MVSFPDTLRPRISYLQHCFFSRRKVPRNLSEIVAGSQSLEAQAMGTNGATLRN